MSEKTVLVIDENTTIRDLCDTELSGQGYRVLFAETADAGVETAISELPDLIILEHQLSEKTGYDVACELLANSETALIPVVASSTLQQQDYAEFADCDNVVDTLPKPYTPEDLVAMVENVIDGDADAEVVDELGESDLSGSFACFGLREIIDMLNNGNKKGMLTVEAESCRIAVYLDRGGIQAVTASGIDSEYVSSRMPKSLAELDHVIKFTVTGKRGSEIDGLVSLLGRTDGLASMLGSKILDPRLLKKLLRLQAAILLRMCFTQTIKSFRFDRDVKAPHLFEKFPLNSNMLSILVESCLICDKDELPHCSDNEGYVRRALRGQNLDRTGLSGRHMKLMSLVSEPVSLGQLKSQLEWPYEEVQRVAHGFELAGMVEQVALEDKTKVFGVITDGEQAQKVRSFYQQSPTEVSGKLVHDVDGLKVLLRQSSPDVLLVEVGDESRALLEEFAEMLNDVRVIGIRTGEGDEVLEQIAANLNSDCTVERIREVVLEDATTSTVEA